MFLKLMSAMPGFIYARQADRLFVNLFIGSETTVSLLSGKVHLRQSTGYPWNGNVSFTVSPAADKTRFTLSIRIPGWARSVENPFGLYRSAVKEAIVLKVNGEPVPVNTADGYADIFRESWDIERMGVMWNYLSQTYVTASGQEVGISAIDYLFMAAAYLGEKPTW